MSSTVAVIRALRAKATPLQTTTNTSSHGLINVKRKKSVSVCVFKHSELGLQTLVLSRDGRRV